MPDRVPLSTGRTPRVLLREADLDNPRAGTPALTQGQEIARLLGAGDADYV